VLGIEKEDFGCDCATKRQEQSSWPVSQAAAEQMQPRTERFSKAYSSLALDALMQLPTTALAKQKQQAHLALALRE
jgi:hypothetical protein